MISGNLHGLALIPVRSFGGVGRKLLSLQPQLISSKILQSVQYVCKPVESQWQLGACMLTLCLLLCWAPWEHTLAA